MQRIPIACLLLACATSSALAQQAGDSPCDPAVPALDLPESTAPGGAEATLTKIFAADQKTATR